MRISKRQLKKIIKEEYRQVLNEYGATTGSVSWYEDDIEDVLFDVKGHGEGLAQDVVWDIANELDDTDPVKKDIQAAVEDWEDYMYSS